MAACRRTANVPWQVASRRVQSRPGRTEAPMTRMRMFSRRALAVATLVVGTTLVLGVRIAYPYWECSRQWARARQSLAAADFAEARKHLERYLHIRPNDAHAHFLMGQTCRRAGDS